MTVPSPNEETPQDQPSNPGKPPWRELTTRALCSLLRKAIDVLACYALRTALDEGLG